MSEKTISRRHFIRRSCATALVATGLGQAAPAFAETEKLNEDDPTAVALGYKHDWEDVDIEKFPKRAGDEGAKQFCDNCALYAQGGDAKADWASCSLFQNRQVAAKGWCNAWVAVPTK